MLSKIKKILFSIIEILAALTLFIMLLIVTYQVIARYVPNMNIPSWTEEIARFLLIYIIAFAGGLAVEKKAYVGMDSFYMLLPLRIQKVFDLVFNLMTAYLFFVITKYGIQLVEKVKIQLTPATQISMSYIYLSLPILGIGMLTFLALDSFATIKSIIKNKEVPTSLPEEHLIYYVSEEEKIEKLKKNANKKEDE